MAPRKICPHCENTFSSYQSLWNHKKQQRCVGKPKSSVYEKIKAMVPVNHYDIPPMKKSTDIQPELMKQIKAEGTGLENNKADQNLIRKIALPQTIEGLLKRLTELLDEIKEGDKSASKLEMMAIVNKLKDKNALTDKECDDICESIEACKSVNSSEDETENDTATDDDSESEDEDINIYQLIDQTVQKVTKNTRENLTKIMSEVDETLRDKIKAFLNGEEIGESIRRFLNNDLISAKIGVLINEIEHAKERVKEIIQQLHDIPDDEVIKRLESLRIHDLINEEQFKRMAVADNDITSLSKALVGKGLWLGRK